MCVPSRLDLPLVDDVPFPLPGADLAVTAAPTPLSHIPQPSRSPSKVIQQVPGLLCKRYTRLVGNAHRCRPRRLRQQARRGHHPPPITRHPHRSTITPRQRPLRRWSLPPSLQATLLSAGADPRQPPTYLRVTTRHWLPSQRHSRPSPTMGSPTRPPGHEASESPAGRH